MDSKATLPDGATVDGERALADYLLERRGAQFARTLASKMLAYALGRSLEIEDEPALDELTEKFAKNKYELRSLVTLIVASDAFRGP
ncbi:MAG: DUF1585 domain-containing protein [Bryobacterales bacterium]